MKKVFYFIISLFVASNVYSEKLKDFTLPVFKENHHFTLSKAVKEKKVVINFWATWCTACIKELEELEKLKMNNPEAEFIAINAGDSKLKIKKFLKKYKFSYNILEDKNRIFSKSVGVLELPRTMVIDKNRSIIYNSSIPPKKI